MTITRRDSPTTDRIMSGRWRGAAVGSASAVGGLYAMRYAYQDWFAAASQQEVGDHRLAVLWLLLLGGGILAVVAGSRRNALIALIPAVVWIVIYGSFLVGLDFPDWSPSWVNSWVLHSYGAHVPVIIGTVSAAAIWNGWLRASEGSRPRETTPET